MNVVMVSPEVDPLAKVGGLADVAGSLPGALRGLGENISLIMPFYGSVDRRRFKMSDTKARVGVWIDGVVRRGTVWLHERKGVPVFLVSCPEFFDREGVYGVSGKDYPDNPLRFAFFSRAVLEAARALDLRADVFHLNDWQSALLPVYQKLFYRQDPIVGRAAVVLSIHNLAYQGVFESGVLPQLGLPGDVFHVDGLEFYGKVNLLKGGILFSDMLSTVSPTYAREVLSPDLGAGLDGVLSRRADRLVGILNGIDASEWDPESDTALFAAYSAAEPAGKTVNKAGLQEKLGLPVSEQTPLLGLVGRLDPQKGLDLLLETAPSLFGEGAQLVILGSGLTEYVAAFRDLARRFPRALSFNEGFQAELARQIYGGVDMFLMPSRYEPCGLGQMIALRYGTVPVVRRTGGLADTVTDLDEDPENGNGFVFEELDSAAFLGACRRAMTRFRDRESWQRFVLRGMRQDFTWIRSSKRYVELYRRAIRAREEAA